MIVKSFKKGFIYCPVLVASRNILLVIIKPQIWHMELSRPIRGHKIISFICEDRIYENVLEGVPRRLTVDTHWLIYIISYFWKMAVWQCLSWKFHSCILFERAARGSRFSNMADILTKVMYLYSTGGLTCYWMSHSDK